MTRTAPLARFVSAATWQYRALGVESLLSSAATGVWNAPGHSDGTFDRALRRFPRYSLEMGIRRARSTVPRLAKKIGPGARRCSSERTLAQARTKCRRHTCPAGHRQSLARRCEPPLPHLALQAPSVALAQLRCVRVASGADELRIASTGSVCSPPSSELYDSSPALVTFPHTGPVVDHLASGRPRPRVRTSANAMTAAAAKRRPSSRAQLALRSESVTTPAKMRMSATTNPTRTLCQRTSPGMSQR
jgi:hypothetical protein